MGSDVDVGVAVGCGEGVVVGVGLGEGEGVGVGMGINVKDAVIVSGPVTFPVAEGALELSKVTNPLLLVHWENE